jgi:hypothetical protein
MGRLLAFQSALKAGLALDANVNAPGSALKVGWCAALSPLGACAVLACRAACATRTYAGHADSRAIEHRAHRLSAAATAAMASQPGPIAGKLRRIFGAVTDMKTFLAKVDAPEGMADR